MDLSTLKGRAGGTKTRKRVGRGPGSGNGKTAGRGHKGQGSRSGYSRTSGFEGGQMPLHRRLPKRGFNHRDRFPFAVVNVDTLSRLFDEGASVTPELLVEKGLADALKGGVKILGRGEITKKLTILANAISPGARAKIEAAGGTVEILSTQVKSSASSAAKAKPARAKAAPAVDAVAADAEPAVEEAPASADEPAADARQEGEE